METVLLDLCHATLRHSQDVREWCQIEAHAALWMHHLCDGTGRPKARTEELLLTAAGQDCLDGLLAEWARQWDLTHGV